MRCQFLSSERGKNVNQPGKFRNLPRFQPPLQARFSAKTGLIALSRGVGQTPISKPLRYTINGQQWSWSRGLVHMEHLRVESLGRNNDCIDIDGTLQNYVSV
ncbi:hypothetical protein [Comamonas testosteroni]|uniref:hypothetical protein n=1 Tax=Comamonas testosteroni TaxID=285 RepID=UPI0012D32EA1|nr:hypothetical protein [Comamonas testosteroni]